MSQQHGFKCFVFPMLMAAITSLLVTWLVVTLLINDESSGLPQNASPTLIRDRETVALQTVIIQDVVSGNGSIVSNESGSVWLVAVPIKPVDQAYSLLEEPVSVKASIVGGPGAFDCEWQGVRRGPDGQPTMYCEVPMNVPAAESLPASMVVVRSDPVQTEGLPLSAVLGSEQQGVVVVVDKSGNTQVRRIDIGVSDTQYIEVVGGIDADEVVLLVPTQLDLNRLGN